MLSLINIILASVTFLAWLEVFQRRKSRKDRRLCLLLLFVFGLVMFFFPGSPVATGVLGAYLFSLALDAFLSWIDFAHKSSVPYPTGIFLVMVAEFIVGVIALVVAYLLSLPHEIYLSFHNRGGPLGHT